MERSLEKTRLEINMDRIDLDNEAEEIETQVAAKKKEQFDKYENGVPGQREDGSSEIASPKKARAKSGSKKSTTASAPAAKPKKRAAVESESEVDDDESEAQPEREPSPAPLRRTTSSRRIVTKASSSTAAPAKVKTMDTCVGWKSTYTFI